MSKVLPSGVIYPKKPVKKPTTELQNLANASSEILLNTTTVFPFTFFPDTITLTLTKLEIVHRTFFASKIMFSLLIQDIRAVVVSSGPLFAAVYIEVAGYEQNPKPIRFVRKKQAEKLRKLIMGIRAAQRNNIDLLKIQKDKRIEILIDIGEKE